jgi:hypothetical protein
LAIGFALVIALGAMSSRAPAQICGMSMPAPMVQCDCCATMKSCLLPQQNPVQPAAASQPLQQSVAIIAPVLHELLAPALAAPSSSREFYAAQPAAHSRPRFALFCTFLI